MVELFLSLPLGTAFHKPSIVCSLFRVQGQISDWKADVQAIQPNHIMTRDKRRCILRLQCRHPSLQRWLFREYQVFVAVRLVPKLCGRYVHLQLVVLFENQGLLAKFSPIFYGKGQILGFLPNAFSAKHFGITILLYNGLNGSILLACGHEIRSS